MPDNEHGKAYSNARGIGRIKGKTEAMLRERRRKVMILNQSGVSPEDTAKVLNESNVYLPEIISVGMVYKDLKRLEDMYESRVKEFNEDYEIGKTLTQLEILHEQAVQQFHTAPEGSAQAKGFLDLAKQTLESKHKFLQSVGLIDKAPDKKLIAQEKRVMHQLTPDQSNALAEKLIEMGLRNSMANNSRPEIAEGKMATIIDVDSLVLGEDIPGNGNGNDLVSEDKVFPKR